MESVKVKKIVTVEGDTPLIFDQSVNEKVEELIKNGIANQDINVIINNRMLDTRNMIGSLRQYSATIIYEVI
jgi:hypothetical protein